MSCPTRYANLPCAKMGVGYTRLKADIGSSTLQLMNKQGTAFPELRAGEYFYAHVMSACDRMCERVKVVAVAGDTLTLDKALTNCFSDKARVAYVLDAQAVAEIAGQVGINVADPLRYDCLTNTLSIDCQKLKQMIATCGG